MSLDLPAYEDWLAAHANIVEPPPCFVLSMETMRANDWANELTKKGINVPVRPAYPEVFVEFDVPYMRGGGVLLRERPSDDGRHLIESRHWHAGHAADADDGSLLIVHLVRVNRDWTLPAFEGPPPYYAEPTVQGGHRPSPDWLAKFDADIGGDDQMAQMKFGMEMLALNTALICMALAHVDNIRVQDAIPSRPTRKRLRRIRESFGDVRVKTLNIVPFSTERKDKVGRSTDPAPVPFHLVRGHFAKYTTDNPLFGKYVGTFWIPAHARGSKQFGTVEHRYRVSPFERQA